MICNDSVQCTLRNIISGFAFIRFDPNDNYFLENFTRCCSTSYRAYEMSSRLHYRIVKDSIVYNVRYQRSLVSYLSPSPPSVIKIVQVTPRADKFILLFTNTIKYIKLFSFSIVHVNVFFSTTVLSLLIVSTVHKSYR